jgi:fatty-acyl-CoA synthase
VVGDTGPSRARRSVRLNDTAVILYTSGTTAHPKGCLLSHEALIRGPLERANERFGGSAHEITWSPGPLFHIASLAPFLGSVGVLGTYLTDEHFDPARALRLMTRKHATVAWPWFPAIMQGLFDHPDFDASQLRSLHSLSLIGPASLQRRVHKTFPWVEVMQSCGMTETAGIYCLSGAADSLKTRAETQGRPVPGVTIRISDPLTGQDVELGGMGEMLVRGYCVTNGYFKDKAKTAEAIDRDGWLIRVTFTASEPTAVLSSPGVSRTCLR